MHIYYILCFIHTQSYLNVRRNNNIDSSIIHIPLHQGQFLQYILWVVGLEAISVIGIYTLNAYT